MPEKPTTFKAADSWLKSRISIPSAKGAREIALSPEFGGAVKIHSFFSAKVAEAHVLSKLRDISDRYSKGEMNLADARAEAKSFLTGLGYKPDDVSGEEDSTGGSKALSNLASTARLDLVFQQNAAMARAVADREVSMDPDIMVRYPYWEYMPSSAAVPRAEHAEFYGLILLKTDPFWRLHTPPWDYNCQCGLRDVSEEEAQARGVAEARLHENGMDWSITMPDGRRLTATAPASGYAFDIDEALKALDMSMIEDADVRREVFESVKDYASTGANMDFKLTPGVEPEGRPAIENGAASKDIAAFVKRSLDGEAGKNESLSLGKLSDGLLEGFGLEGGELRLSIGNKEYGIEHNARHHLPEMIDSRFLEILQQTLWNPGASVFMQFTGGKVYLAFYNAVTKAYALALKNGPGWREWELVSAQKASGKYAAGKSALK